MKFTTATALSAFIGSAAAAKDERTFAVLRFNNKQLVTGRVDPIVNPGKAATHVHTVFGGSNFGMSSTGEELRKSKCTNAKVNGDMSNYWIPSLYFKDPKSGNLEAVELFYSNIYYFFEPTNDDIKAFPVGLSMLSGDVNKRTPPEGGSKTNLDPSQGPIQPIKWTCPRSDYSPPSWPANSNGKLAGMQDPVNKGEGVGFPDMNCDGYASPLRADIHFPSCYNPKAGLTDYKNNMAFPTENNGKKDCPEGWIHVPHLFYEAYWNTPAFKDRWEQGQGKQPFVLSNGDATGYSLHGDFMSGWDEKLLQHIIDTCDAGTAGMDKCPGLFYGVNDEECTIKSPITEKVEGPLQSLPGNVKITGWGYGGDGDVKPKPGSEEPPHSEQPGSKPTDQPGEKPTSVSGSGDKPQQSDTPPNQSSPAPQQTEQAKPTLPTGGDGDKTCLPPKTHTVYETVTVTAARDTTPTPTGDVGSKYIQEFKYAGCFKDSEKRVLNGNIRPNLGPVSNKKCIERCKTLGFSVAGTEYGGQCYCGNEISGSEKLDESQCATPCEGDNASTCGGSWALSVYSTNGEVSMTNSKIRRHMHDHIRRHPTHRF